MANSLLFLLSLLLLFQRSTCASNLHKIKQLKPDFVSEPTSSHDTPTPIEYFEVTRPIEVHRTKPCSYHVLQNDFGSTYGKPPVLANYTPPSESDCPFQKFSKIVLEWKATCKGRQFDRIFGVWLGGVEILRSCTAEPTSTGIVWTVQKDITRYQSLLTTHQTLAVYMGNIVDRTYTGVYHVDITIHFYPAAAAVAAPHHHHHHHHHDFPADLILPISRNLPLDDGLWFEIQNSTDVGLKELKIPQNAFRAVLEVYVSFHEKDEFWYTNPPNVYLDSNNLTDPGNGPFREVVVTLDDDKVIGSVWPFTVIFTGGVNPLLWRPVSAIGSFNLPSYDIEVTPFLGTLLDGKTHSLGFTVTHALNVWYIDANLHLWLDKKSTTTQGKLLNHIAKPLVESQVSNFQGLNGAFWTNSQRFISSTGWVTSSFGNITTSFVQDFNYKSSMVFQKDGSKQTVNQEILFNDNVHAKLPEFVGETNRTFSLYLDSDTLDLQDTDSDSYSYVANITLGFEENKSKKAPDFGVLKSSLKNVQDGNGTMVVKNNLVVSGMGVTKQDYRYSSKEFCYFRQVGSSNYSILYDRVRNSCNRRSHPPSFGLNLIKKFPFTL